MKKIILSMAFACMASAAYGSSMSVEEVPLQEKFLMTQKLHDDLVASINQAKEARSQIELFASLMSEDERSGESFQILEQLYASKAGVINELRNALVLCDGALADLKVQLPDWESVLETFHNIGNIHI